jgi:3-dehydroshikimate dehydratase
MKLSLCTITFRHHLVALEDVAVFARANDFHGIELWGAHARHLGQNPRRDAAWLADLGLSVPMISHYLPMDAPPDILVEQARDLFRLAGRWRTGKVRIFAGSTGSAEINPRQREDIATKLRELCRIAGEHGLLLLIETHPGTLADTLTSTLWLIEEVDHPALRINFDTLHVWEGGDEPRAARAALRAHIAHYHLKNVRSRADLGVFEPGNVYAASGRREGMVPLFDGVFDYAAFLDDLVEDASIEASLEWFGNDPFDVLRKDHRAILRLREARERAALPRAS